MLDTNFLIALEEAGSEADRRVREWLAKGLNLGVCSIVWSEYLCGPLTAEKKKAADVLIIRKEPFDVDDAPLAAHLFNCTNRRRGTFVDCMIAAVAIRCQAKFATFNHEDFTAFIEFGLNLL
ncbi:MAG: type II toxin-antitoxin system VapC family toxin [Verrucomicrobiota bacterium]